MRKGSGTRAVLPLSTPGEAQARLSADRAASWPGWVCCCSTTISCRPLTGSTAMDSPFEAASLLELPSPLLESIFALLPLQDIAVVGQSCKRCRAVAVSNPLWLTLCESRWGDQTAVARWLTDKPSGCFTLPQYRELAPVSYRCFNEYRSAGVNRRRKSCASLVREDCLPSWLPSRIASCSAVLWISDWLILVASPELHGQCSVSGAQC